jgi:hypothetical protein
MAYVEREARALSKQVAAHITDIPDPAVRSTEAIITAVEGVRADPVLHSWFRPGSAGVAAELGSSSALVNKIATAFVTDDTATSGPAGGTLSAQFIVRMIVSLLMTPGADSAEERTLVERFVTPAVLGDR